MTATCDTPHPDPRDDGARLGTATNRHSAAPTRRSAGIDRPSRRRAVRRLAMTLVVGVVALTVTGSASAPAFADAAHGTGGAPVIERDHVIDYRLTPDDFFIDLCGIVTNTTVKEVDILKTWPDGSQSFHAERSFIPDDPRLPIERGAGTSYFAPDGTMLAVIGKPIQLIGPDGGVRALDAGQTVLGDPMVLHGHHDVGIHNEDLAPFYCPPSGS